MFYMHSFSNQRAFLITASTRHYYTTNTGGDYHPMEVPIPPNTFGAVILHFHATVSDNLMWTGNSDCEGDGRSCHAEAHYSTDNGRNWHLVEKYVRNCAWARDAELKIDKSLILCESYKDKSGNQQFFDLDINPLQLYAGTNYYQKKQLLFERVVGFAKFSEFLIVAEVS